MLNKKLKVKVLKVKLVKDAAHFSVWQLAAFVVVFGGIGSYIILRSFAASALVASVQSEKMTLPAGSMVISDQTASGGQAVRMTKGGTSLTSQITLPNKVTSMNLTARGVKCRNGWPQVSVLVDGSTILAPTTVSSTSWRNYSANVSLSAATHSLKITYSNSNNCGRYLYLDVASFYGDAVVLPTVSISATPTQVDPSNTATLSWTSTNALTCTASGAWSGTQATSGSVTTKGLFTTSTYGITCTGASGSTSASTTVTVNSSAVDASIDTMRPQVLALGVDTQNLLATKSDASDTSYYSAGQYYSADMSNPTVLLGPATEAAALWVETGRTNTAYYQRAVDAIDLAISKYQNADGSIGDPTSPDSQFYGNEIGKVYYYLNNDLDATHKANWQAALGKVADFLVNHHNLTFYTNGNIMLGQTTLFWLTWNATGQQKYKDLFEQEYAFMISPTSPTWDGYGLMYSKVPTKADGSDGAGYLTEQGSGAPGYDGDYTHFQFDEASDLYMLSGDVRFLRLSNLFFNQIIPHVDQTTWVLDATNGSRHSLSFPVYTGGVMVLAWKGGRTDLLPVLQDQFTKAMYSTFYGNAYQNWGSPGIYRTYGSSVVMVLVASHKGTSPGAGANFAP